MFRNRENQLLLFVMCLISLVGTFIGFMFTPEAALLVFITSILLISCHFIFTYWRYREIEKLSSYLRRISSGNYSLDIRDNHEGELSILKSNIYKVTLLLSEQGSSLQRDKNHLTDAISDISHQLKTPLTSMMVMADLLYDPKLPDSKRMEFTHNIHIQLERINWLVSSLLKFSKMDAGTVHFKQDLILVHELIEKALEPVHIPLDIKEQTVSINGQDTVSLRGDFNWTVEALLNILKNCVEHTAQAGAIHISFSENTLFTEIIIMDHGKGIAKEDLPYIFNRFYKGQSSSEDSVGIGLAMAYTIITSQGGDLEVKSEQGKGTEFRIKFYKQIM